MKCFKCGADVGNNIDRLCPKCSSEFTQYYAPQEGGAKTNSPASEPLSKEGVPASKKSSSEPQILFSEELSNEESGGFPKISLPFSKPSPTVEEPSFVKLGQDAEPVPEKVETVAPEVHIVPNIPEPLPPAAIMPSTAPPTSLDPQVPSAPGSLLPSSIAEPTVLKTRVDETVPVTEAVESRPEPNPPVTEVKIEEEPMPPTINIETDKGKESPLVEETSKLTSEEAPVVPPILEVPELPKPGDEVLNQATSEAHPAPNEALALKSQDLASAEKPVESSETPVTLEETPPALPEEKPVEELLTDKPISLESIVPETKATNPPEIASEKLQESTPSEETATSGNVPPVPLIGLPNLNDSVSGRPLSFGLARSFAALVIAFFVLAFVSGASLVAASYTNVKIPFLPDSVSKTADAMIASVPLIPKTSKQILTKVFASSVKQESYYQSLRIHLQTQSGKTENNLEADVIMRGPFDATDLSDVKFGAKIDGYIKSSSFSDSLSLELRELNNSLYFDFTDIPRSLGAYVSSSVKDQWFRMSLSEQLSAYGLDNSSSSFQSDRELKEIADKMAALIEKHDVLDKVERKADEKIGDVDSYHLSYTPDKETLKDLFKEYLSYFYQKMSYSPNQEELDNGLNKELKNFEKFEIGLWIDKSSYFVNRTSLDLTYKLPDTTLTQSALEPSSASPDSTTLQLSFDYTIASVNHPQGTLPPADAKDIHSIYDLVSPSGTTMLNLKTSDGNLKQVELMKVATAAEAYSVQHDLTYPNSLTDLKASNYLKKVINNDYKYKVSEDKLHFSVFVPLGQKYLAYKSVDGKVLEMSLVEAEDVETKTINAPSQVLGISTLGLGFDPLLVLDKALKWVIFSPLHF